MATSDVPQQGESRYYTDAENAGELARLNRQARMFTQETGGLFPKELDLAPIRDVLDIACGPGTWALDVAQAYPQMKVTGIDISQLMISFANSTASGQDLPNAHFQVMDVTKPLDFPSGSFDLINARTIGVFMPTATWPKLLAECKRLLRDGGVLVLTEGEMPLTTSLSFERLTEMTTRALHAIGQSFSPDGRHMGTTVVLSRLLREAGFQQIRQEWYASDFSIGTDLYKDFFYPNFVTSYQIGQPFLVKLGVTTQEEVTQLYNRMLVEICANDFCAIANGLKTWGRK
jgi:SAM-dependent methyltransferase